MSEKATCPGCDAHSSSVYRAIREGGNCPHCGLSHAALAEVLAARERGANAELTAKYEQAVIRADHAEQQAALLAVQLDRIRELANRKPEDFEAPF